jgi:hypothetical protein
MSAPEELWVIVKNDLSLHSCYRTEKMARAVADSRDEVMPLDAPHTVHNYVRASPAPHANSRDRDWILAMAEALGTDSQYTVPIVPSVEAFRTLFAAVRAAPQAGVPGDAVYLTGEEQAMLRKALSRSGRIVHDGSSADAGTRELLAEAIDLVPRVSDDDPMVPALVEWLRKVRAALTPTDAETKT